MTEDEMVGWHHQLNGHEFEQTPGGSEGQERLAFCSPWGHKELDTTEHKNTHYCSVAKSCANLRPHELQHTRLSCP